MASQPVKRACDACHRRKVRCSGGQPCQNCGSANLACTYNAIPQKKGPKGSRAKVISELRETQKHTEPVPRHKSLDASFDFNTPPISPAFGKTPNLFPRPFVERCIDFFFLHMYPTMPILQRANIQSMVLRMEESAEAYCLIGSLCAFMMIQPGMSPPELSVADTATTPFTQCPSGAILLEEVQRVRQGYDYIENPSVESVITSFFLFAGHFGLDKHNTAWSSLREATTIALILNMQDESAYLEGDFMENCRKRRLYWLIFSTERAYALQRHRPISLHATIELPKLREDPTESHTIEGFLHLINLFRPFDDTFIGLWNKARNDCSTPWLAHLQKQLTAALPPTLNVTDSQAADLRTTQQWLRTMVWQLSITNGYLSSSSSDSSMTFQYPVEISRDLVADLSGLPLASMEVHGIGLIEKVFDVACTLTDVISCVPFEPLSFEIGPSGYLQQFLNLISRLKGGRTKFLPLLLAKVSETLPSVFTPTLQSPTAGLLPDNLVDSLHSSASTTPYDNPINPMTAISPIGASMIPPTSHPNPHYLDPVPPGQGTRFSNPFPGSKPEQPLPRSISNLQSNGYLG